MFDFINSSGNDYIAASASSQIDSSLGLAESSNLCAEFAHIACKLSYIFFLNVDSKDLIFLATGNIIRSNDPNQFCIHPWIIFFLYLSLYDIQSYINLLEATMSQIFQFSPSRKLSMFSILVTMVSLSLACNSPLQNTTPVQPDREVVETAVQMTLIARSTEDNPIQQPTNLPPTTQAPPTSEPTATHPPPPTATATSSKPMVSVSVNTNCRIGPGAEFKLVSTLLVGEEAEIVARDPSGDYWYIRNIDSPSQFCWLWGNYATPTGNYAALPVFTPMPTPTPEYTATPAPNFSVSFNEIDGCVGWNLEFYITNTGSIIQESFSITVTDNDTSNSVTNSNDKFEEWNGCLIASSQHDLLPGEAGYAVSGTLLSNPAGHDIDATIRVCSQNGLGGTCIEKNMSFTP
jgi:hypothetical protein